MTLIEVVIMLVVLCVVGYVGYWIIMKFFTPPIQTIALAVLGLILLIILIANFVPGAANYRVWR